MSCNQETFIPKPKGYMRPYLPAKTYQAFESNCPFEFEFHENASIRMRKDHYCWFTIQYPQLKAEIHLTYKPVENNLSEYLSQTHKLAYDHHFKASNILEKKIQEKDKDLYGLCYFLEGEVASNTQFFLTDSTDHFVRGSLYFNSKTQPDSLAPYLSYINADIDRFIESFKWK